MKNICLVGFMGTGKSSVAKEISLLSDLNIIELDSCIEKNADMSIPEIFNLYGEKYFRDMESDMLLQYANIKNSVISCGGGIVLREENIHRLRSIGSVILLNARAETVYERIRESENRPILKDNISIERIRSIMDIREPYYKKAANFVIDTDNLSVSKIAEKILNAMNLY